MAARWRVEGRGGYAYIEDRERLTETAGVRLCNYPQGHKEGSEEP